MNVEAKSKLDTLSIQLKKHTAAFDKYTIKKKEVLEIIVEIKSLIQKFNETIGENSGAKKELKELLGVIDEMPVFSGELRDDELVDVFTELQDIKKKLEGIGDGSGGSGDKNEWHHGKDENGREFWYNNETGRTSWTVPLGGKKITPSMDEHQAHPENTRPPRRKNLHAMKKKKFGGPSIVGGRRKRGGFKFTSNAIKSRKSRYMTRKRKSKSPKRRQKTRKTPKRRKRTRRKRRKGRKRRRKSQRKRRR